MNFNYLCAVVLVGSFLAGCSSTPDKYAWTKDLPVAAESTFKEARRQDIRIVNLYETRKVDGKMYVRGQGYAEVNDKDNKYFWQSKKAPVLEITVTEPNSEPYRQCQILFDQMKSKNRALQLLGDGFFVAKGNEEDGFIGVFRIDRIEKCVLTSP
jgi:hypothetical protein